MQKNILSVGDSSADLDHFKYLRRFGAVSYRLALKRAQRGVRYHALAGDGVSLRDVAEAIGKRLTLSVKLSIQKKLFGTEIRKFRA